MQPINSPSGNTFLEKMSLAKTPNGERCKAT